MPGKRADNRRVYPDANHQPRHMAKLRKEDSLARQAEYDKLSLQEKLDRLPPEPHSAKQRTRLLAQLQKSQTRPVNAEGQFIKYGDDAQKKHGLKAKERRAEEKK